jgi:membrane-associated phospholipid phosphatase
MTIRDEGARSDIRVHPVLVTAVVGLLGWLVLAALAVGLGALVNHVVVGHTLGHDDLEVARWFAARRAWPQCGLLVVTMAAEGGVYLVATYFVSRNRPAVPRLEQLIVSDSYPSGHSAAAMAMYGSLCIIVWSLTRARVWRALFLALAFVGPLIVGTSRVYRGMHNVTDVICGILLGAACIVVGCVAVRAGLASAHRRAVMERSDTELDERPPALLVHGVVR